VLLEEDMTLRAAAYCSSARVTHVGHPSSFPPRPKPWTTCEAQRSGVASGRSVRERDGAADICPVDMYE